MKPNILFLLIDSLRADRVFGKEKNQNTPNIDALIEKGAYFSNAITTSQYTG
ncbi:sulfatase-like hydrolase/transferase, partial [Candidatus Woesearchaeota archaeon]|nr:sulfatase-like hydrolase/transferase [Candidatus Woesearchaeota archaeon]